MSLLPFYYAFGVGMSRLDEPSEPLEPNGFGTKNRRELPHNCLGCVLGPEVVKEQSPASQHQFSHDETRHKAAREVLRVENNITQPPS
jgi:hypothetical protein